MSKSTAEIRQMFLDFFHEKGHEVISSSSLIPHNDSTLLFTNAGMNQFKDVFLGKEKRDYTRATTSQRCVRAGGKHNDLDNVGYTARHHTFFEMLGNFSFGDYFKKDAIHFAWEFLTGKKWLALSKEKLLVTVYENDEEAYFIWSNEIGIPNNRIIRIGDNKGMPYASDNFWQMGDTGPCGPSSEIFYDHGDHIRGGPPGTPEEDGDRFIEIWNIVFMQFNRETDGKLLPLPKPSVDTGMGLERIAAVLQHVNSNYDIDIFNQLIRKAAEVLNVADLENKSLRVIADHIRSCAYLIVDGVLPSNEGRGYVLRRIIRRAVRHGHQLGAKEVFFYKLIQSLIDAMGSAAQELKNQCALVESILKHEEEQFLRTLERGLSVLDAQLDKLSGNVLSGDMVFKLYDTYGFPFDLTADVCRERNIQIDEIGFKKAMESQRQRARESNQFSSDYSQTIKNDHETEFAGYQHLATDAKVLGLFEKGESVSEITAPAQAIIVLDRTPFYGESGGQIGDKGILMRNNLQFDVIDTQKYGQCIGHVGTLTQGTLRLGDTITAAINVEQREKIKSNHSATHLLHAALRQLLGDHISQKGSLVTPDALRFDFSHAGSISSEDIMEIENKVNAQIRGNLSVKTEEMSLENARKRGATALFGEKYKDPVRVLSMGDFSVELCGGTHVMHTGDIGLFRIISESSIAAGVRRIEAITGQAALDAMHDDQKQLNHIAQIVRADKKALVEKITQLIEQTKSLEKEMQHFKIQRAASESAQLLNNIVKINDKNILVAEVKGVEAKVMRTMIDEIKNKVKSGVVILALIDGDKIHLAAGVTQDLTACIKAGEIISLLAEKVGGKGGGRSGFAQAGGSDIAALPQALSSITETIKEKLM